MIINVQKSLFHNIMYNIFTAGLTAIILGTLNIIFARSLFEILRDSKKSYENAKNAFPKQSQKHLESFYAS